jgi:hypothetical protein
MSPDTDNLARRLALAERALLAVEAVMAQAREAIETARQAIADAQVAAVRQAAAPANANGHG